MAVPEDNVSHVVVVTSVDVQTLLSVVSQVSVVSSVEGNLLVNLRSPWSNDSSDSDSESLSLLVRDGVSLVGESSDGSGSSVEDEPLSVVLWLVVSDSQSVLVATDVLVPEEGSEGSHSRLDLELDVVTKWLLWIVVSLLVNVPGGREVVVAVVGPNLSHVSVDVGVDIQAELVVELDVLSGSVVPPDLLSVLTSVLSDDGINSGSNSVSISDRDGEVSSGPGSDGSSSGVE